MSDHEEAPGQLELDRGQNETKCYFSSSYEDTLQSPFPELLTPMSAFMNCQQTNPMDDDTNLVDFFETVRSDQFKGKVDRLRQHLEDFENEAADKIKRSLPAVMLSGVVKTRKGSALDADRAFAHSGWLQCDFDGKDHPRVKFAEIKEQLKTFPSVQMVFDGPSGVGCKAVIRIPADVATHAAAFDTAAARFAEIGLTMDPSTRDPGRLCFVSHDPDAWMRDDLAEVLVPAPQSKKAKSKKASPRSAPSPSSSTAPLETTAEDIREMLGCIPPRPAYEDWLKIASAVWSELDAAGTPLLEAWSPEETAGEYDAKYRSRLKDVRIATLVWYAKQHGFNATAAARRKHRVAKMKVVAAAAAGDQDGTGDDSNRVEVCFDPGSVYYDTVTARFLVDAGRHYRAYSRRAPVIEGIRRFLVAKGMDDDDASAAAERAVLNAEIDAAVDWCGPIAGHKRGILRKGALSLLVTTEPELVEPATGRCPLINGMLRDAFAGAVERVVFTGWLSGALHAVRSGMHQPAPMMVLAGAVNTGKSLLAWLVGELLGGRTANPFVAWSGTLPWNDNLAAAELLIIDDSVSSTDIRTRREFGARFKEAIYSAEVEIRRRNVSAISLRPVWRVLLACNDTADALSIIPPFDDDLADKISLLRVHPIRLPVDTSSADGKRELQRMLREEFPAFVAQLLALEIPPDMRDSRSGMMAWRDPELSEAIDGLTPEHRLDGLLRDAMEGNVIGISMGGSRLLTASEIEGLLCDSTSPVRDQARHLLGRSDFACGRYLGRLAKRGEIVQRGPIVRGIQQWELFRPESLEDY